MALESATTIAGLISSNPTASDPISQGDDHIALIKTVLKTVFPGAGGTGFSVPLSATEAELNFVHGVTSAIQTQLNNEALARAAIIPAGTKVAFYQATPPVGWTATAIQHDSMMRVVTSGGTGVLAGGYSGAGSGHSPIINSIVAAHTHTATSTSTVTDHGHVHTSYAAVLNASGDPNGGDPSGVGSSYFNTTSAVTGITVATSTTLSAQTNSGNWQPKYMNFCVGKKS